MSSDRIINAEKLIKLVCMHSEIYDTNHRKYNDVKMKEKVWKDIGRDLNQPSKVCKKTWINLRDSFRRAIRNKRGKPGGSKLKQWKYEKEMSFLIPFFQDRKTNLNESEEEEITYPAYDVIVKEEMDFADNDEEVKQEDDSEDTNNDLLKETPSLKRKIESVENESSASILMKYILEKNDTPKMEDPLTSFFSSICATVRTFSPYHQVIAKSKIFAIISELEMNEVEHSVPHLYNAPLVSYSPTPSSSEQCNDNLERNQNETKNILQT